MKLLSLNDKMFYILKKLLGKINRIQRLTESWHDISIIFTILKVENKTKTSPDQFFSIPELKELVRTLTEEN